MNLLLLTCHPTANIIKIKFFTRVEKKNVKKSEAKYELVNNTLFFFHNFLRKLYGPDKKAKDVSKHIEPSVNTYINYFTIELVNVTYHSKFIWSNHNKFNHKERNCEKENRN